MDCAAGWKARLMPAPPAWLKTMANAVAEVFEPVDLLSPIGCHFHLESGIWEVTLFASTTEVVGGVRDGTLVRSRFALNLMRIQELFSHVESMHWQALPLGADDDLGPHVAIEGTYAGQRVWLRVLARPPRNYPAGRHANVYELAWEDVW
jgi:hypothetical protein